MTDSAVQPDDSGRTVVLFGNPTPQMQITEQVPDEQTGSYRLVSRSVPAAHLQQSVTRVVMRDGFDDPEEVELALSTNNDRFLAMVGRQLADGDRHYAVGISEMEQVVAAHTAGGNPDWVTSTDPDFARVLSEHFGCPLGEPMMLLTNGGRDAIHAQAFGTSAQPAASNYMALTANATAPAATDTTLAGEIATAGGGLIRAQATYAHTAGTNTTTLTKTFTANGTDALPVTVAKIGIFNAAAAGTMTFETALNATATLTTSGDNVTVTETITAG